MRNSLTLQVPAKTSAWKQTVPPFSSLVQKLILQSTEAASISMCLHLNLHHPSYYSPVKSWWSSHIPTFGFFVSMWISMGPPGKPLFPIENLPQSSFLSILHFCVYQDKLTLGWKFQEPWLIWVGCWSRIKQEGFSRPIKKKRGEMGDGVTKSPAVPSNSIFVHTISRGLFKTLLHQQQPLKRCSSACEGLCWRLRASSSAQEGKLTLAFKGTQQESARAFCLI